MNTVIYSLLLQLDVIEDADTTVEVMQADNLTRIIRAMFYDRDAHETIDKNAVVQLVVERSDNKVLWLDCRGIEADDQEDYYNTVECVITGDMIAIPGNGMGQFLIWNAEKTEVIRSQKFRIKVGSKLDNLDEQEGDPAYGALQEMLEKAVEEHLKKNADKYPTKADLLNLQTEVSALKTELSDMSVSGMTKTAKDLLIYILRNGTYSDDMKNYISALDEALSTSTDEPDSPDNPDVPDVPEPPVIDTYYDVSFTGENASNSNDATTVKEGNPYSATITADEGYRIVSIVVKMGDVDITEDVVSDGVITIESVTGDVEITVVTGEKIAEPIYHGENFVFDGKATSVIDTGIKLCDEDKSFTIVVKLDTPIDLGGGAQIINCSAGSTGKDGYVIEWTNNGKNTNAQVFGVSFGIGFVSLYNATDGREQLLVYRHEAGSGKATYSALAYNNTRYYVATATNDFTFAAHDNPLIIGARRWNGINGVVTGTIKQVDVYDVCLSDEVVDAMYAEVM